MGRLAARKEPAEEQRKMFGIEKPEEMTPTARCQEIAEFLAKGFLRLRKRVDYPEIIRRAHAESAIARPDSCPEESSQVDLIPPAQPSVHCDTN